MIYLKWFFSSIRFGFEDIAVTLTYHHKMMNSVTSLENGKWWDNLFWHNLSYKGMDFNEWYYYLVGK